MNKKGGLFTLAIGTMAITLLAVAIFSAQAVLWEEESEDYLAVMGDVRMAWANTVLVFDAAIADAATDSVAVCGTYMVDQLNANYLEPAISKISAAGMSCTHSVTLFSAVPGAGNCTLSATITVNCEKELRKGFGPTAETPFKAGFAKSVRFSKTSA